MKSHIFVDCSTKLRPSNGDERHKDGTSLASSLLAKISSQPLQPKIFLLFATPDFFPFHVFVKSIWDRIQEYRQGPFHLIGCSAAAIVDGQGIHRSGAILTAICSDTIEDIRIAAWGGRDTSDIENAPNIVIDHLVEILRLKPETGAPENLNPNSNRLAFMFLPGFHQSSTAFSPYRDNEYHKAFCDRTNYQIPVFGGSAADRRSYSPQSYDKSLEMRSFSSRISGWQFLDKDVYENAAVVVLFEIDTKIGLSMQSGLTRTNDFLEIEVVDPECDRTIVALRNREIKDLVDSYGPSLFLSINSINTDPIVLTPFVNESKTALSFLRRIDKNIHLEVLTPNPEKAKISAQGALREGMGRAGIVNADGIASVMTILCKRHLRLFENDTQWINRGYSLALNRKASHSLFGAFLSGECSFDSTCKPALNNMQLATCLFGKERTFSAKLREGYQILAETSNTMLVSDTIGNAIRAVLNGLRKCDFSGAMLSLVYSEHYDYEKGKSWIVAQSAYGKGWPRIVKRTRRALDGSDILAQVLKKPYPILIVDSTKNEYCDKRAVNIAGVVSQCIIPLSARNGGPWRIIGILQIDLDDLRLGPTTTFEGMALELRSFFIAFGNLVGATLSQSMNRERLEIRHNIDMAVAKAMACLSTKAAASTFLKAAIESIGVDMAHIRLYSKDRKALDLLTGTGLYYNSMKSVRKTISAKSDSPTAIYLQQIEKYGNDFVMVVHDIEASKIVQNLYKSLTSSPNVQKAHKMQKCFANFAVYTPGKPIMGVFCLASSKHKWYFSQHRIDALRDIGQELALLIDSSTLKEDLLNQHKKLSRMNSATVSIGHALKSPLNRVLALLSKYTSPAMSSIRKQNIMSDIGKIERDIRYAFRRLNMIGNYVRRDIGPSQKSTLSIIGIVNEVLLSYEDLLESEHIKIVRHLKCDLQYHLSKDDLIEILEVLVENAREAMPKRGRLIVESEMTPRGLLLQVSDNGMGIAPRIARNLFKPYNSSKMGSGFGLGLYNGLLLAKKNSFDLSWDKRYRNGARFRIFFPSNVQDHIDVYANNF